jgi:hypothetical protein
MSINKSKCLLKVHFLDNEIAQVVLAEYLKTGTAKDRVLTATNAYLYPLALAQQPMTTSQELELALLQSVQALQSQAVNLINFFRLNKGITLTPEQLAGIELMSPSASAVQTHNTVKTPMNVNVQSVTADEDKDDLRLPEHPSFEITI